MWTPYDEVPNCWCPKKNHNHYWRGYQGKPIRMRTLWNHAGNSKPSALILKLYGNPQCSARIFPQQLSLAGHYLEAHKCFRVMAIVGE